MIFVGLLRNPKDKLDIIADELEHQDPNTPIDDDSYLAEMLKNPGPDPKAIESLNEIQSALKLLSEENLERMDTSESLKLYFRKVLLELIMAYQDEGAEAVEISKILTVYGLSLFREQELKHPRLSSDILSRVSDEISMDLEVLQACEPIQKKSA